MPSSSDPAEIVNLGGELEPNSRPRIEALSAFLITDANGNEGIASFYNQQQNAWVPMVTQSHEQLEQMRPMAHGVARNTQRTLRLARFSVREDMETFEP